MASPHAATAREIERRLRERFSPVHLELLDSSDRHAGHAGAADGGGHFEVLIVAEAFSGLALVDRHRRIHEALGELLDARIHALGLRALTLAEWAERGGRG